MYIEKEYLLSKINEFCEVKTITLTPEEKQQLATNVSCHLDESRTLTCDDFIELLDHNALLETYENIDFNDEIVSIEPVGEIDMIDFNVSGDKLFFGNGILTHNSATNNTEDADNSNVSDSMGTVMTADFMIFLLQNEEMKERKEIICKITKNRFGGITDTWMMGIDYEHMSFHDLLVQTSGDMSNMEINESLGIETEDINEDFMSDINIITPEKQKSNEEYANKEIKAIIIEDVSKAIKADNADPFDNKIDDLFNELGLN
jgi:hypothetical protein